MPVVAATTKSDADEKTNRQTNKQEGRGAVVCVYFSQHATGAVSHAVEEGKVAGA